MALLTNSDLINIISDDIKTEDKNKLIIHPLNEEKLTPVGYDLSVGSEYILNGEENTLSIGDKLKIPAKNMALICTLEEIRMPKNKMLSAIIQSKVSLSCKGLSNISTTVDADWKGNLLIAVHNNSKKSISINYGDALCTILFIENKSPAKDPLHSKPNKRVDIRASFKINTKSNNFISFIVNSIPPLISVLGLWLGVYLTTKFYPDNKYLTTSVAAVSIFIAGYTVKFIEPTLYFITNRANK